MSRLRIVRLIPFFHHRWGGCVAQGFATSAALAARGHHVRVLTADIEQPPEVPRDAWVPRDGYQVWYARVGALGRVPPYWQPQLAAPLRTCLRDADVLCVNVGLSLTGAMARKLARGAGVPYVYNAEGALCPVRLRDKALRKRAFLALFERRVLRDAGAIHAVTRKEAADVVAQGADAARVHVVPNAVVVPDGASSRAAARAALGWPADEFVILFAGRLVAMKAPDVLLAAAAPLLRDGRARLVFAGPDDGMVAPLREQAQALGVVARVHFAGLLTGADLVAHWRGADVFVLPSHSEGMPLAALEAAANGLPLIVSEACNLPEVAACNAGAVVRVTTDDVRRALLELAGDVELRSVRAENARSMVVQHFSLPAVVERLERLYAQLAAR